MARNMVTYFGIPGSYSYIAARQYFGEGTDYDGSSNFRGIFESVTKDKVKFGVVPVENTLAGSVYEVFDLLWEFELKALGEVHARIEHSVLAIPQENMSSEALLKEVTKIFSHSKALEQCQKFLELNPHIEPVVFSDTARAAKFVIQSGDCKFAAIASSEAATLYGLRTIATNVEDNPHNFTRFLILGKEPIASQVPNKCSLIFTLPHLPQSLLKALNVMAHDKINIAKVESRPIHGKPFEYVFYVDFEFEEAHLEIAKQCVEMVREKTLNFKLLGFYPRAKIPS